MNISEKLRELRLRQGLSQEELAQRLNVARQTVGKWESGQAMPEIPGMVALCDLFHLSLDRLLREDDCVPDLCASAPPDGMTAFLLHAKRATYAGHGREADPTAPGSHDYTCEEGPWSYRDRYFGGSHFAGEEVVRHQGVAVWCMNYAGRVIGDTFSGDFLKEALCRCTAEAPFRGPDVFRRGDWLYRCRQTGARAWFSGREEILCGERLVYEGVFHGGDIK